MPASPPPPPPTPPVPRLPPPERICIPLKSDCVDIMRVIISELIVTVSFDKIAEEFDPHRFESDTITIPFDIFENIQTSLMTRAI